MAKVAARTGGESAIRKRYEGQLCFRAVVMALVLWLYFCRSGAFSVLKDGGFLKGFSPLHLLWGLWMGEMAQKLRPARRYLALGAQKQFGRYHVPTFREPRKEVLTQFVRKSDRGAGKVLLVWTLMTAAIGLLAHRGVLGRRELFLLVVFFYLCDLICVVVWCPFRVFWMKNKCCTTCRIFNWDHMMMFVPFLFMPGFFGKSLLVAAGVVLVVWEAAWRLHPQRFWEETNQALQCKNCTDRICGR